MKTLFSKIGCFIRQIIDLFYPPFRRVVSINFFRYGVSGGINLIFDWVLFFLIFNFVLRKQMLHLGVVTLSSHIATLAIKFPVTLLSGFLLQKYVTFSNSVATKGRIQLLRYLFVVMLNLLVNYLGLKFFVEIVRLFPSIANMAVSVITVIVSYVGQKKFAFRE
ncbi:MAG: GtrA family protein [Prevotellaceae bacterium]|nr:GtrA family protein [Prevotellaceae bacterium]